MHELARFQPRPAANRPTTPRSSARLSTPFDFDRASAALFERLRASAAREVRHG